MFRTTLLALTLAGGLAVSPASGRAADQPRAVPRWVVQAHIALHRPLHAPKLLRAEAVAVARHHSPGVFGHSRVDALLGAYDPGLSDLHGAVRRRGLVQVWLIHTAGLTIANPGGLPGGTPAPTLHQSVIVVADDTGTVLAQGYAP